jgi:hypothetical protein
VHGALTGAAAQDGTDIPLMKDKLVRATWSFKGHGALSDVDTQAKQNNSILNGTRRPLSCRTALLQCRSDWRPRCDIAYHLREVSRARTQRLVNGGQVRLTRERPGADPCGGECSPCDSGADVGLQAGLSRCPSFCGLSCVSLRLSCACSLAGWTADAHAPEVAPARLGACFPSPSHWCHGIVAWKAVLYHIDLFESS